MLHVDLVSDCERDFVRNTVSEGKRVDGRTARENRPVRIEFGLDRGCCIASLEKTKVLAQVSSELTTPKLGRPNEGYLVVNFELSPMAAPNFEPGRLGDYGVEIGRLLERCIHDSRCVDLESLCLVNGEKVWQIRVDVQVLNHCGNVCECASVATIAALLHARIPNVTIEGNEITVHNTRDSVAVPIHMHHHPYCVSFAFYESGGEILADPTELEEKIADGILTVGANGRQEVCVLHQRGCIIRKEHVLLCTRLAGVRAKSLTEIIKQEVQKDEEVRKKGTPVGFAANLLVDTDEVMTLEPSAVHVDDVEVVSDVEESEDVTVEKVSRRRAAQQRKRTSGTKSKVLPNVKVFLEGTGTAAIGRGGPSTWDVLDDDADAEDMSQVVSQKNNRGGAGGCKDSESSEEEEMAVLQEEDFPAKGDKDDVDLSNTTKEHNRGWYSRQPF
ncbi:exosome complex component RRP45-like [Ornithodoros turicata]|uniref:exosome complex component RRP45-like n=1 Tax=Ornithodoros turicata TaxID=34597 RepID=UPI00313937B2